MTSEIPFSGLAPDSRRLRGGGELYGFNLQAAMQMGREIRRLGRRGAAAEALAEVVNALEHDRRPVFVLVQVYAGARLLVSRGIEPQWSEAAPAVEVAPYLDEIREQLRQQTKTSLCIDAPPFSGSYGVKTLIGFGAAGEPAPVVLGWARSPIDRGTARNFETVALYARLAFLESSNAPDELRAAALDEIVTAHEAQMDAALAGLPRQLEEMRRTANLAAETSASQLEQHNRNLRRTQRAMLNVVEDLREARTALASRVEERTRELALANRELEARNRELEDFAYIASHDLQEPLRTVGGYLQMIERRYKGRLDADADDFIRFAIEGAQRMQALIESLLHYSRIATFEQQLEAVPLDQALDAALQNLAGSIEQTQALIARSPLPSIRADRTQMTQLFQNLLGNALKFSGGKPPRIYISCEAAGGACLLAVRDEGIGFEQKFAERIFKIFRRLRRDTPGTGVGLAVCKKIVERHGGTIDARSAPGEGATFTVRLPSLGSET
jgi:signal transduction histidine kinase